MFSQATNIGAFPSGPGKRGPRAKDSSWTATSGGLLGHVGFWRAWGPIPKEVLMD
jgi:hypothetical protein